MIKILFLGDVVGSPGRRVLKEQLGNLCSELTPDLVIANGENAAGGLGIDRDTANEIFQSGVELITTGNHVWQRKGVAEFLEQNKHRVIRPVNFPPGAPGVGWLTHEVKGVKLALLNAIGRVFMPQLVDCPFRELDAVIDAHCSDAPIRIVDFHAEATSEKLALGHYLDGRVSLVLGTHTHVQTADEKLLPGGTAFISDIGMCGPQDSVIGVKKELIVERFVSGLPGKFDVAKGPRQLNGVLFSVDNDGKALGLERVSRAYD